MTIFGFLLGTLPVIFIGAFSYITSSNEIQKNVNSGKMQLLSQINSNVEHKLTTVNHTLNQVVNSTVLKKSLNEQLSGTDFTIYNDLRTEVRNMQSFDTKLEDVILINQRQNWMVKNSGLYRFKEYEYHSEISTLMNTDDKTSWVLSPSHWFYSEENEDSVACDYTISLVKKLPTNALDKYGLALANIPACSLYEFINSDEQQLANIVILNEQFNILMHSDQSFIGKHVTVSGLEEVDLLTNDSGQFTTTLDNEKYSISYLRSELNGWIYLSITSLASMTKESDKIGTYTLYVCLFMLITCIIFAWIGSRRMYSPIEKLLNQVGERLTDTGGRRTNEFQVIGEQVQHLFQSKSRLEKEVNQHIQQVKTFYLIKAYQGNVKVSSLQSKLEQFGYGPRLTNWNTMAVLTMQIDFIEETRYEKRDLELLLFAVQNMVEEIVPAEQRLDPVIIDQTIVTFTGSQINDAAEFKRSLYSLTEQLQQQIISYLDLQVSIGISLPINNVKKMSIAYREGLDALKHRIKLGTGIIIQYENINSGKHYLNLNYPNHTENELLDAIKLAETDKSKELLKKFITSVFSVELSPQEYQIPLTRLLNNLLIVMQESGIGLSQIIHGRSSLFEELLELHTVPEIEDWFWSQVIHPMIKIYRGRQDAQYHNISEKIIDIVQHEYDQDITLEECASRLHYNANYLSSVFRKETNYSFSEYLTMYRFNMAKKWLEETDMPIKDIASKLRYNNPQNFIRSFRKQEGMTPGQYRDKKTKE